MQLLDSGNMIEYLGQRGWIENTDQIREVRELAGGVSNVVFLIQQTDGTSWVLKQSREQLRVEAEWKCSLERIYREVAVLQWCRRLLESSTGDDLTSRICVPHVLYEDRANYCFAMSAASIGHTTWKQQLMAGSFAPTVARQSGWLLGTLHRESWHHAELAESLDDLEFFRDLRLQPYYRHLAARHTDIAPAIEQLLHDNHAHRVCLVHGDFSPKNLLVSPGELMLIDCEVGHYGDPAFDLGFFLTHLVLKAIYHAEQHQEMFGLAHHFCDSYFKALGRQPKAGLSAEPLVQLEHRAVANLAACMLARVDGKSPVEYLSPVQQDLVRRLGRQLFTDDLSTIEEALTVAKQVIETV